ncbi:ParB family chromosome partitioning protein [Bacteriovorax stolpii]|uniref:ParB/RepB/Spo0J family partition protein n=1 Tax=Bacteriovorax stolpii TaxID=960 RepID=UPI0010ECBC94|nr:ParB/RepB/Spo0J family partition protein [Bacteriovorax stolpii]TDP52574.1 ParB family chromosome partitioning protein [Bacteriovorax stolpii]
METRRLKDLKATNPYLRLGTDVSELEKSIQTVGLIAPLVISPDNVILAGARRFQALLNLGYVEAPVMIVDKGELERELVSIDENLVRKDLTKIEVEGHLRRAKEIYQALNPHEEETPAPVEASEDSEENEIEKKKIVLPAEKFLNIVAEKTGLSPKQIHEAINRDEMASKEVKEARINGELSLSQTNEIVKLKKEEQEKSLSHIKTLPVREIKKFVKIAKVKGVEEAIKETPKDPHSRDFLEVEAALKKLVKKLKQLELEGMNPSDFPADIQNMLKTVVKFAESEDNFIPAKNTDMYEEAIQ